MKMKKRRLMPMLSMILSAAMLLAGCTKEETNGETNGTTTQDTAQQGGGNNGGENQGGENQGGENNGGSGEQGYWVDLGLPSGLLWAKCNIGATTPEEYGSYYAWGETQPKSVYNLETYVHYDNVRESVTRYCNAEGYGIVDNLTTLQASDDAATVIIGNGARIPTADEWCELRDNCTSAWTTKNGVNGRLLTGSNGNTLFLPAAGAYWDSDLFRTDDLGSYWSSSLYTDNLYSAWGFDFVVDDADIRTHSRTDGLSIRPVRSAH